MKLFTVNDKAQIHFYAEPIRMNAMIDRLSEIVASDHKQKPRCGDVFVFLNKKQNYLKALFYHKHGFQVLAKRLDPFCRFQPLESGQVSAQSMLRMLDQVVVSGKAKLRRAA